MELSNAKGCGGAWEDTEAWGRGAALLQGFALGHPTLSSNKPVILPLQVALRVVEP
jgi:hypothetical protein